MALQEGLQPEHDPEQRKAPENIRRCRSILTQIGHEISPWPAAT